MTRILILVCVLLLLRLIECIAAIVSYCHSNNK